MLKVALLEQEEVAKNIIFELGKQFQDMEWTFQYFSSISEFIAAETKNDFILLFIHEHYDTPRFLNSIFVSKPQRIIIFTTDRKENLYTYTSFERVLYIDRRHIKSEIKRISPSLQIAKKGEEEYLFSYNYVEFPIKYRDIFYIEKEEKQLVYHTRKGEFRERKNMKDAQQEFAPYDFLRIHASFLVNMRYITKIDANNVYLRSLALPFARNRKQEVRETPSIACQLRLIKTEWSLLR